MPDSPLQIDRFGMVLGPPDSPAEAHRAALASILEKARADMAAINLDGGLNSYGRQARAAKVLEAARKAIDAAHSKGVGPFLKKLDDAKAAIPKAADYPKRNRVTNDADSEDIRIKHAVIDLGDRLARQSSEAEIRRHLLSLDPADRRGTILSAAASGDLSTLMSAKTAPGIMGIADAQTLAEAETAYLRQAHPEPFAALAAAEQAWDGALNNYTRAAKSIGASARDDVSSTAAPAGA